MRILLISPAYPPAVGGAATFSRIIASLVSQDSRMTHFYLLTERMKGEPTHSTQGNLTILRLLPNRLSRPSTTFAYHALSWAATELFFSLRLHAIVKRYNIDLVHFHTRYQGPLFRRAIGTLQRPRIAELQDKLTAGEQLRVLSDWLVCCGEGVQRHAIATGYPQDKLSLIPVPIESIPPARLLTLEQLVLDIPAAKQPYILYVGDISSRKGVYELLAAIADWEDRPDDLRLLIVGINRDGKAFTQVADNYAWLTVTGHLKHIQVQTLMRHAAMVVLPSKSEGLPRVMVEALLQDCKVVAPPNIPEFDREMPEFVFPTITPDAIREKIEAVYTNPQHPNYPVEKHKPQAVADAYMTVYEQVVQLNHL